MDVIKQLKEIVDVLNKINRSLSGSFVTFFYNETPVGTIDGTNDTFTITNTPISGSLQLFLNGMYMTPGGEDYTLVDKTITFVNAPVSSSIMRSFYNY